MRQGTAVDFAQRVLAEDLVEGPQGFGTSILVYLSKCSPKKCNTEKMLYGEQVSESKDAVYVGSCTIFDLQLFLPSSPGSWKWDDMGFPKTCFLYHGVIFPLNHEEMGGRVYLDVPGS